ncbi:hypothetical protein FACS1894111_13150 [Clostridia bacterium]|nr:hypothetical protein FACS1894111_13150 [Clostridia bacterium]
MRNRKEIRNAIEEARSKLDQAMGEGADKEVCYLLSLELDQYIEEYIDYEELLQSGEMAPRELAQADNVRSA